MLKFTINKLTCLSRKRKITIILFLGRIGFWIFILSKQTYVIYDYLFSFFEQIIRSNYKKTSNMKIIFASHNENKVTEIQMMLPPEIQIVSLQDIGHQEEIPETANTIEGNAILKANYITQKYGCNCFADDSGLEIEALQQAPGVYSARYAGPQRNDQDNINKVLRELENQTNRIAQFKTVIAFNYNGTQKLFTGIVKGTIASQKRGYYGFGYDPIFIPNTLQHTFAELLPQEKNKISHRLQAVQQLIQYIKTIPLY